MTGLVVTIVFSAGVVVGAALALIVTGHRWAVPEKETMAE